MAVRRSDRAAADKIQLGVNDALRLAGANERLRNALQYTPQSFAEIFHVEPDQFENLFKTANGEQTQSGQAPATTPKPDSSAQLDIYDALRMAEVDEVFGAAFLSYPEDFITAFDLDAVETAAIGLVSENDTIEAGVAKVRTGLEESGRPPNRDAGIGLDVNDALGLAALDESFASALKARPAAFTKAFSLTESDLERIADVLTTKGASKRKASRTK